MRKSKDARNELNEFFAVLQGELNDKTTAHAGKAFAIARQVQRMRKRAKLDDGELHTSAVANFVSVNDLVGTTSVRLDPLVVIEARRYIEHVLERFTTSLDESNIQQCLDPTFLYDNWKFGPGASNGVRGTHASEKINQEMTCTVSCKPFVSLLRKSNLYFQLFDERNGSDGIRVVNGSRLATVLKNETTRRTIAIEPSGNMALQLAAGIYLEGALRMVGLDIRKQQPINKALAHSGSIDGGIATIDLKSASDMFSIDLIRQLFPRRWFRLLTAIRSEEIEIKGVGQVRLNMMSTMGNGFTFPLMTLTIAALIYAVRRIQGGPNLFIDWRRTAVFGDDIIIPTAEYASVVDTLERAGLVVNTDKSYSSGPFRESCGGDYYEGYDVTPFYVSSLDSDAAVYVAINQTLGWCAKHELILPRSLLYLKSLLDGEVLLVPEWCNPDQGILTAAVERRYKCLKVKVERRRRASDIFDLPLAIGGYIESTQLGNVYTPRLFKTRWCTKKSRLPNGYLDGADPLTRSTLVTSFISSYSFLFKV